MILSEEKQKELVKKRGNFQKVSEILKTEFFGLDNIIDEIMNTIESWYLYPEYQTRPLVVNLWGMTGTGKTSLVRRLSEHLKMDDKFIHIDMGEQVSDYNWGARSKIEEALVFRDKEASIICLDEFQLCRTIVDKLELDRVGIRLFWELIDTGMVSTSEFLSTSTDDFKALLNVLRQCIVQNVMIKDGMVVDGKDKYLSIIKYAQTYLSMWQFDIDFDGPDEELRFIPESYMSEIYELFADYFETPDEFEKFILSLDGMETIKFLKEAVKKGQSNRKIDMRQSVIFVIGNLDEVFQMSHEHNPDIDPDVFYQHTLSINSTQIKEGLAQRFRIEQIARLGNNHIAYPALSSNAYKQLIENELKKISERFTKQTFSDLLFDKSINDLIYSEGVFPFQGARPVLTSVVRLIDSNIGSLVAAALNDYPGTDKFVWYYRNQRHEVVFFEKGKQLNVMTIKAQLQLESLRESRNNNRQALVAVHECGHAITTALSTRILPLKIITVSPQNDSGGFCQTNMPDDIISRRNIRDRIISVLGGYIAEKLIFGEDNISIGSGTDLAKASFMANESIKQQGLGSSMVVINSNEFETKNCSRSNYNYEDEAETLINNCKDDAVKILQNNRELLIQMARHLTTNSKMEKDEIKQFILKYSAEEWVRTDGFIEPKDYYDYKDILFKKINDRSS